MRCSIIIPLYNKAEFITDAINSILHQSYQDFEIIVIDDGSTDDGINQVRAIKDVRINTLSQANSGVSVARNTGIDISTGELIFFLDADDWYFQDYLKTIVTMAKKHPEDNFFATSYQCVKNTDAVSIVNPEIKETSLVFVDNLYARLRNADGLFVTNSVCIRRTALAAFKPYFPAGEQWGEDQDLWFRISEKYRLVYFPQAMTAYRMEVTNSLCASFQPTKLMPYCQRIESRALLRQMPERLRSDALKYVAEINITLVRRQLMAGQRYLALCKLFSAWRGMLSKRWWISLIMCIMIPPNLIKRWENWRKQRKRQW